MKNYSRYLIRRDVMVMAVAYLAMFAFRAMF